MISFINLLGQWEIKMRRLSTNQKMTISIALATVIIAILTFYFSFLRVSNKLVGNIVMFNIQQPDNIFPVQISIEMSFSNTGNQDVVIKNITMELPPPADNREYTFQFPIDGISPDLPLLVEPSEIRILSFSTSFMPGSPYAYVTATNPPCDGSADARLLSPEFSAFILDASGNMQIVRMMEKVMVCINPQKVFDAGIVNTNPVILIDH
jgi:hypothetical protein